MKLYSLTLSRTTLVTVCGVALAAGVVAFRAQADQWDKRTTLTVNQPIQVRDTVLDPGQYVFKLLNSSSDRHIVQIFNHDQSRIIDTVMAIPKERMEPTGDSQFTFWETPPGTARALRAWFYPGDTIGQEFPYPKHVKELAMVEETRVPAPAPTPAPETTTMTQPEQPETAAPPPPPAQESNREEQPEEVAQSAPPPAPEQAPPAPAPEPQSQPQKSDELPKTASPYPMIGLFGVILLGASALLRLKRMA